MPDGDPSRFSQRSSDGGSGLGLTFWIELGLGARIIGIGMDRPVQRHCHLRLVVASCPESFGILGLHVF